MPRLGVLEVCFSISPPGQKRHAPSSKTAWSLHYSVGMPSYTGSGWAEEEFRRVKVNFTFENFDGQDEGSSEASAFQREEVELAKPFLIWHVTETSH